jgi:signal transduction histidine kinase
LPREVHQEEIKVYSHSTLLYWWPAWAIGFVIAFLNTGQEQLLATADGAPPSSALGLTYLSVLLLLIVFTNVRLRGINSVVTLLTVAFIAVLLAWFGWWDNIVKLIPYLSVHMNTGFYLVFSSGLLIIWLMMFFIFDRLTFWRIRPGQMIEEHLIGGGADSFDTNGLRFQKHSSDFFRAALGLGAGDLMATVAGGRGVNIEISNVVFVDRKIQAIERLISVKPEHVA